MDILDAIRERHSVRAYKEEPISLEVVGQLRSFANELNASHNLHIQIITNEPKAFSTRLARYGRFRGANNYIAMVGKKGEKNLHERIGYCGEALVLRAQQLGLNTCWAALTYGKVVDAVEILKKETMIAAISLGYGIEQGRDHKSKARKAVLTQNENTLPQWFLHGVDAALLAPTAMNQQKFSFTLINDNQVKARSGLGFYAKIDIGIVKYHFEIAVGKANFSWV